MTIDLKRKRILITRGEPQASVFAEQVTRHGGQAIVTPLIQITCTSDSSQQEMIERIYDYEWIIFTSANGVNCFFSQLERTKQQLNQTRFAVVGPKTNKALQAFGFEADFIPSVYNAKTMGPEFLETCLPDGPVLLVQGQLSGTVLEAALEQEEVPYNCMKVYKTETNEDVKEHLKHVLRVNEVDFITFMSPSTVDAFIELAGESGSEVVSPIVCVGTTTAKRAREHGFTDVLVPEAFTVEGMMEKMDEHMVEFG